VGPSGDERPISDYGVVGDTRTAALVSSSGAIDWLCLPRFDADPVFARLVGGPEGGTFRIGPAEGHEVVSRRYHPGPTTLETTWRTEGGQLVAVDAMVAKPAGRLLPATLLVRRGRGAWPARPRGGPAGPRPLATRPSPLVRPGPGPGRHVGRPRPRRVRRRCRHRPRPHRPSRRGAGAPADGRPHRRLPRTADLRPARRRVGGRAGLGALVAGMDGKGPLRRAPSGTRSSGAWSPSSC
jgi:hypothetical protein